MGLRRYLLSVVWASGEVFTTGSYIEAVTFPETVYQLLTQGICGIAYAYLLGAVPTQSMTSVHTSKFDESICSVTLPAANH